MAKANVEKTKNTPALSPGAKENELCALAVSMAEQQLRDGTATSQVLTHFLRLATERESLEKARLIEENKLLKAKTAALESAQSSERLALEAIEAMKRYSGSDE